MGYEVNVDYRFEYRLHFVKKNQLKFTHFTEKVKPRWVENFATIRTR